MADISAIKALDGVTYSIKDSEAREHLVPSAGTTGQVLTKTASGYGWADASGGGNVDTVNSIQPDANKNVQTVVELTQAQYDALVSPDPNVVYYITDGSTSYPTADDMRYQEGVSVADALDTLNTRVTWRTIIAFSTATAGTSYTLSESIEDLEEVLVEIIVSNRITTMVVPVAQITADQYGDDVQFIISMVESSNPVYNAFMQFAFTSATTFKCVSFGKYGWTGTVYLKVMGR